MLTDTALRWMLSLIFFRLRVPCSNFMVPRTNGCLVFFRVFGLPLVVTSSLLLILGRRHSSILAGNVLQGHELFEFARYASRNSCACPWPIIPMKMMNAVEERLRCPLLNYDVE